MQPHQIISLMDMGGPTMVLADHADHIHVGFQPLFGAERASSAARRAGCCPTTSGTASSPRLTRHPEPGRPDGAVEVLDQGRTAQRASRAHYGD